MNKIIRDFIEAPNAYGYGDEHIRSIITGSEDLLGEALCQEAFVEKVFSPYRGDTRDYLFTDLFSKILTQFPDRFLSLAPEYFINSLPEIGKELWSTLPRATKEKIVAHICPSIELFLSKKMLRFSIPLEADSFLAKIEPDIAADIIAKITSCCYIDPLDGSFLSIIRTLPVDLFERVVNNSHIGFYPNNSNPPKLYESLPQKHRDVFLQAVASEKVDNFGEILKSESVGDEFLNKNASRLLKHLHYWAIESILEARPTLRQSSSNFVLLAASRHFHFSKDISEDGIREYCLRLKTTQKTAWAYLLRNPYITAYPCFLKQALKCYCALKSPPVPPTLKIPDRIIAQLTSCQLKGLAEKEINEQGRFLRLKCNASLIFQGLTSFALAEPTYYQQNLAGKLALAVEKQKHGETICEKICRYLEIDPEDAVQEISHNKAARERAINKAVSARSVTKRCLYVSFIMDMLEDRDFSEIQAKYRGLHD